MKKLKSFPEVRRPRGFMVTGIGRRGSETYASFVARSFGVDGAIHPARLVNLIVVALLHQSTDAKRPPIMILDNFDRVDDEDKTFVRLLVHAFFNAGITLVTLCQNKVAAKALVHINGWKQMKGFPGLCTSPPFVDGQAVMTGWSPTWTRMSWSHRLLTELIQNHFPRHEWDIDGTTGILAFLFVRRSDGSGWDVSSALAQAELETNRSPRQMV
jgi:hypothetical protein